MGPVMSSPEGKNFSATSMSCLGVAWAMIEAIGSMVTSSGVQRITHYPAGSTAHMISVPGACKSNQAGFLVVPCDPVHKPD